MGYGEGEACTVESLVLQHLSQREEGSWAGWHCEGSPLRALWALLMWDVIFTPVADVFQVRFFFFRRGELGAWRPCRGRHGHCDRC